MDTELKIYTVEELLEGFTYNELEEKGLFGLSGKLVIQPEYQRNYIYAENNKENKVIQSLLLEYPLGLMYFVDKGDGSYEVLDGQQRITSIGRFLTNKFAIRDKNGYEQTFRSLDETLQKLINRQKLLVYICKGEEPEIKEWFKVINVEGITLTPQEVLNALHSGSFVTAAKERFSNSNNPNLQKWLCYMKARVKRQEVLQVALQWVSSSKGQTIEGYMGSHRNNVNIDEMSKYFDTVIDWVSDTFKDVESEMQYVDWGRLYEQYHKNFYDKDAVSKRVQELIADTQVRNNKGVFEYILGGEKDVRLLEIRIFEDDIKKRVYIKQTEKAKKKGISNCPLCAISEVNKTRIWEQKEMDADHVRAWSKGGATTESNCQMLCITHNRAKGNK